MPILQGIRKMRTGSAGRVAQRILGSDSVAACLVFLTITLGLTGCQTIPEKAPIEKDGNVYGTTKGLFRHRWWNYYERALSFADGGFWDDASSDLLQAISQRTADQRRARTYGMHFVDYFPHRELGIVFYNKGHLNKALSELTASLASVKSAKAELYLDRVRKALIERDNLDRRPPEVNIDSPKLPFFTNASSILVQGVAHDDTFVRDIKIGSDEVRIDVSNKKIPFKVKVPLVPGLNNIPVVITDLAGKKSKTLLKIAVDRSGPIIRIDETAGRDTYLKTDFSLKGQVFDDQGLAELVVNGRTSSCRGKPSLKIDQSLSLAPGEQKFLVEVRDLAGNTTTATLDVKQDTKRKGQKNATNRERDHTPPLISIRGITEKETTFLDQAFIEGNVRDNDVVTQIAINGVDILDKPGRNLYFSRLVKLKAGVNVLNFRVMDGSGNVNTKQINIERVPLKIRQVGSRLRVAVNAFKRASIGTDQQKSYGFEDLLTASMINRKRFSAVERQMLSSLLEELKLSQTNIVDESTALKLGRILAADCMLLGSILERKESVEVYARLVDTETTEVLAAVDVYGEDVDVGVLRTLSEGMELKLNNELPVVEGLIVKGGSKEFILDIGKDAGIKSGMKLIVYDLCDSVVHPNSGQLIGRDFVEIGQARIQSVMEGMSYAFIIDDIKEEMIKSRQRVITR
ncbi:CsgG/HfaB family protein [Desulfosarcina variabilis]|uniref:CsgG/HfaB family protein n=1 Tax=Desulfosarcina variabilis TaxID=2300 RepID=UPI003AFAD2BE